MINTCRVILSSCFPALASPVSKYPFCKLNQGEVCGITVFPHADVWGRAGSIFRICSSFFMESPLLAPSSVCSLYHIWVQERRIDWGRDTENWAEEIDLTEIFDCSRSVERTCCGRKEFKLVALPPLSFKSSSILDKALKINFKVAFIDFFHAANTLWRCTSKASTVIEALIWSWFSSILTSLIFAPFPISKGNMWPFSC